MSHILKTTVTGGYNGGAIIDILLDNVSVFTATGDSPYNLNYNETTGSFVVDGNTVNISVTPPQTQISQLIIDYSGYVTLNLSIQHLGQNTSYGYNYSNDYVIGVTPTPSFDPNSPTYKINFTDGSFITVLNGDNPELYNDIDLTFTIPNFLFGAFEGANSVIKTDSLGNTWEIDETGVIINNTITLKLNNNNHRAYLSYYPSSKGLRLYASTSPSNNELPSGMGFLTNGSGLTYNGDVTNTPYASIGEWIKHGVEYYESEIGKWYTVINILPITSPIPVHTINIFGGINNSTLHSLDDYLRLGSSGYDVLTYLNIDNTITDYNPVISGGGADPYEPGGTTGGDDTGGTGGTGDFDGTSDSIDIPSLPTLSATDTGFITLFNPTITQLQNLANYMWSSGFDLDTFKKLFADPMNCILGLSIVPVNVPSGNTRAVSVGNISTDVQMTVATSQYVEVDCGTLNVNEFWGAYLDYDPYTKAEIYLPYIGTHPLAVDDIMGKAVHVVYHVDILSGACCAYVKCGDSVLYSFIGQCSSSIPITGNDWTNVINGVLSIAGAIGTMVATGGASAPMSVGVISSTAVNGLKPNVEKSGSMSGTGGMMGIQTPYLILTRPRQALPSNQNVFMGYPSFITKTLSSVSGYTEVESVHLEGIHATEQELSEIETLLKTGVIL